MPKNSAELKQRIISAVILLFVMLAAIFWLPTNGFLIFILLIMIPAGWEWATMSGLISPQARITYIASIILLCLLLQGVSIHWILLASIVWWVFATYLIVNYPAGSHRWAKRPLLLCMMGFMIFAPCVLALQNLQDTQQFGPQFVLCLMGLIWIADSAAYFTGKAWGKHKLAPSVSPGKSWQGVFGATVGVFLLSILAAWFFGFNGVDFFLFLLVCMVSLIASIVGDLMESMIKREAGMKDSGSLIPGHGGVCDRIDSLTSAAPVFLLGLFSLGV